MSFLSRLNYDPQNGAHHDGAIRYMMIRPDAFMGILHELPEADRPALLAAMARSITTQGAKSARAYQDMGAAGGPALLEVIAATAPELGWGIWSFSGLTEAGFDLRVRNSPFAAGYGPAPWPVCAPIAGMLAAVGQMVLGRPVTVIEHSCSAMAGTECLFGIRVAEAAAA